MHRKPTLVCAALLMILGSSGCSLTGPATLSVGRPLYNQAIHETTREQLLLNLVRSRYRDGAFFLDVASVSTNFEFRTAASAGVTLPSDSDIDDVWDLGANGSLTEKPTVTYTPLAGEAYVKALLSPVDVQTLVLLFYSGWKVERIFRTCIAQLGRAENALGCSGPTPSLAPEFREFKRACDLFQVLQMNRQIQFTVPQDTPSEIEIRVDQVDRPEWQELAGLVGFPPTSSRIRLTLDADKGKPGDVQIYTRSVVGSIFYLSHSVEAPREDQLAGLVTMTKTEAGEPFEWAELHGDLFRVRFSEDRPDRAAVVIPYRSGWYYVDDSDLSSKSTFQLLSQLFQLNAGTVKSTGPILTLPVSR